MLDPTTPGPFLEPFPAEPIYAIRTGDSFISHHPRSAAAAIVVVVADHHLDFLDSHVKLSRHVAIPDRLDLIRLDIGRFPEYQFWRDRFAQVTPEFRDAFPLRCHG